MYGTRPGVIAEAADPPWYFVGDGFFIKVQKQVRFQRCDPLCRIGHETSQLGACSFEGCHGGLKMVTGHQDIDTRLSAPVDRAAKHILRQVNGVAEEGKHR